MKYDNWVTTNKVRTFESMNDKFAEDSEPIEILNGTAVWVPMKKDLSQIFYDPSFSIPTLLEGKKK